MTRKVRVKIPRQIRAGAHPSNVPGERVRCAVLASTPREWVGVDLRSGALVRNCVDAPDAVLSGLATCRPFDAVAVVLGPPDDVPDPARPEALVLDGTLERLGSLSARRARKLLRRVAAPEREGATLLRTRGPSIAFEDLDGSTPSVVVVRLVAGSIELVTNGNGAIRCSIEWGGVRQALPLGDPRGLAACREAPARVLKGAAVGAALGFVPGFALVGLGAVERGHAPKVVLSLLTR